MAAARLIPPQPQGGSECPGKWDGGIGGDPGRAPTGPWGSDGWSSSDLTAPPTMEPHPDHRPAQKLVLCLCFLARDPIAMDYCNWGQVQKSQEGEAEGKEGNRDERHWSSASEATLVGPEAVRRRRRASNIGWMAWGAAGETRELAGAQVQRREEM